MSGRREDEIRNECEGVWLALTGERKISDKMDTGMVSEKSWSVYSEVSHLDFVCKDVSRRRVHGGN